MPKPITVTEVSKTEIIVHKRGNSARYVLADKKTKRYTFKEIVRMVGARAAFPLSYSTK